MIVFLNGKFLDAKEAKVSIFDHGFMYGDGVFERLRTYGGKIWNLKEHTARLFQSARLLRMHVPFSISQVEKWTVQTVKKNGLAKSAEGGFPESNIRVELTRGEAEHNLKYDFISKRKPTLLIVVAELHPWPEEFYKKGIPATTYEIERSFPEVKTTSLLAHIMAMQDMHDRNAKEALLIDRRGAVTEGTTSNVFFVKEGKLLIPEARVLPGTTAKVVIALAKKMHIPIKKRMIRKKEIYRMDEGFLTSVTRGVMPISAIDGKKLQQKTLGKITKMLLGGFQQFTFRFTHEK